ncbi:DUF4268 domain-containing protein [Zunongwangia atlantica]|uniref:DUF4268 domain-containing protein n=1 Tax=Zunongwangia atlantica 22II14-10F7 TaxID=1185767 RepID=A0A1Y1T041_9FLAO|nr:DUF4268 domain-containing protein [Zunongwangia atlantica]ORL44380.1 hypothetical protein IIF7_16722 [Zunongwangia atlantica 22II14-10F7]
MFSREESKKIRQEFWTSFGQEYSRKWILYNTKVKEIQLKFTFAQKRAIVSLDIESDDIIIQAYYFEKLESLKTILKSEYLANIVFDAAYELPEGKTISRIYIELQDKVSINNKSDWPKVKHFFAENMHQMEMFWLEFKDFITS